MSRKMFRRMAVRTCLGESLWGKLSGRSCLGEGVKKNVWKKVSGRCVGEGVGKNVWKKVSGRCLGGIWEKLSGKMSGRDECLGGRGKNV